MAEMIRVGILGAGGAGSAHATAFSQLEAVQITALWSRTRVRAEGLVDRLHLEGVQVYDWWQDLVEQAEVDVISVATPELLRREPVTMALERVQHLMGPTGSVLGIDPSTGKQGDVYAAMKGTRHTR